MPSTAKEATQKIVPLPNSKLELVESEDGVVRVSFDKMAPHAAFALLLKDGDVMKEYHLVANPEELLSLMEKYRQVWDVVYTYTGYKAEDDNRVVTAEYVDQGSNRYHAGQKPQRLPGLYTIHKNRELIPMWPNGNLWNSIDPAEREAIRNKFNDERNSDKAATNEWPDMPTVAEVHSGTGFTCVSYTNKALHIFPVNSCGNFTVFVRGATTSVQRGVDYDSRAYMRQEITQTHVTKVDALQEITHFSGVNVQQGLEDIRRVDLRREITHVTEVDTRQEMHISEVCASQEISLADLLDSTRARREQTQKAPDPAVKDGKPNNQKRWGHPSWLPSWITHM